MEEQANNAGSALNNAAEKSNGSNLFWLFRGRDSSRYHYAGWDSAYQAYSLKRRMLAFLSVLGVTVFVLGRDLLPETLIVLVGFKNLTAAVYFFFSPLYFLLAAIFLKGAFEDHLELRLLEGPQLQV